VFLSSHILSEVEALCDRVSIIRQGRNVETGTLAAALLASPAAISGAVRFYRLQSDHWYEMVGNREHELQQWAMLSREGVDVVGADTRAGRRLEEIARFFEFLINEMPGVLERWRTEARTG
jgi:ABC-type multidrug transport system ATPase subunit